MKHETAGIPQSTGFKIGNLKFKINDLPLLIPGLSILYLIKLTLRGIPTNLFEILIYVVFIATLLWDRQRFSVKKSLWPWVLLALIVVTLAIVIAPDTREALGIVKGWLIPALGLWLLLTNRTWTEARLSWLLKAMMAQGVLVAGIALLQLVPSISQWWGTMHPDVAQYLVAHRSPSLFNSPNAAATILSLSLILSLTFRPKKLMLVVPAIIALGLVATGSRGAIIAAVIGLLVVSLARARLTTYIYSVIALSVLIINPVVLSLLALRHPDTMDIRVHIWRVSWQLITKHPLFGLGLGGFQQTFAAATLHQPNFDEFITPFAVHPHNIFLYTWLLFGLVGVLGLIVIIIRALMAGIRSTSFYAIIGAGALTVLVIHGMVDNTLWKNDLIVWFVVILVLINSKLQTNA